MWEQVSKELAARAQNAADGSGSVGVQWVKALEFWQLWGCTRSVVKCRKKGTGEEDNSRVRRLPGVRLSETHQGLHGARLGMGLEGGVEDSGVGRTRNGSGQVVDGSRQGEASLKLVGESNSFVQLIQI